MIKNQKFGSKLPILSSVQLIQAQVICQCYQIRVLGGQ